MNRLHHWLCRSALWGRALENRLLPWAIGHVPLGDDVLELGPGPGLTTALLAPRVKRLTALELDTRLAQELEAKFAPTDVRIVQGDGSAMPFADDAFSTVLAFTMLHHLPSASLQDKLFAEAYRVLEPGGTFAGIDNTWNLAFALLHIGDTLVAIEPSTLEARLEAVHFTEINVECAQGRFRFRARKPR